RTEPREVRALVLLTFPAEQVSKRRGNVRVFARAARHLERQRGEVRALDVVVEVGGREDEAVRYDLHGETVSIIGHYAWLRMIYGAGVHPKVRDLIADLRAESSEFHPSEGPAPRDSIGALGDDAKY